MLEFLLHWQIPWKPAPGLLIIFLIFGVSGQIIMSITGAPLPELMTILMSPLLGLVDSIGGIIFLAVLVMILWWFGIHDSVITGPLDVFLMSNYSANMAHSLPELLLYLCRTL